MTVRPGEPPEPIVLSHREWELLEAMRQRKEPTKIAEEWGTSRQNADNIRRGLQRKGVIIRRGEIPVWMKYSEDYPWIIREDLEVRYAPAIPPEAVFRVFHPVEQTTGLVAVPTRVVRWASEGWTVQGLPARAEAQPGVMTHRVVWCRRDTDNREWVFAASVGQRWLETHTVQEFQTAPPTRRHRVRLTPELRVGLTRCVAVAIGVDAVLDLSVPQHDSPPAG
jgi:hypothetical protein